MTQNPARDLLRGDVLIDGDRIAGIGTVRDSADEEIDATGCAVLPGFVNAHTHVANTLLRGTADDVPLDRMLEIAFGIDAKLTRRDVQIGALLGCVEMLRAGTTSFHDMFYWEDEVARAVRESGLRGFLSWVVLDADKTTQRGDPVKNAEAFVRKHRGDPLIAPSVAPHGVYTCSEETYRRAKDLAESERVRLHTHVSETRGEVYRHLNATGMRPVEWLDRIGLLSDRLLAAHCVWVTIREVELLARHGVAVAHCPVSNMKLASGGCAPIPEMRDRGVAVGLGTDSPLSNNGLDPFGEMKTASLLQKSVRWDAAVLPAQAVLDMATIDAARALGAHLEIGSIEVGKRADIAVVDLRVPHATPFYRANLIRHLVYSARGGDVRATLVAGEILMRDGVVRTVDEADVISRANEIATELHGVAK